MKIRDGKIVEATENELFDVYLKKGLDDIMPFDFFMMRCKKLGTEIKAENDIEKENDDVHDE